MLVFTQIRSKTPWLMFKKFGAWIIFYTHGAFTIICLYHQKRLQHKKINVWNKTNWFYYHAVRLYIINIFIRKIAVLWDIFFLVYWFLFLLSNYSKNSLLFYMWQEQFLFSRNYIKSSKDNIALEAVPRVVRNTYTPWIHKNKKKCTEIP